MSTGWRTGGSSWRRGFLVVTAAMVLAALLAACGGDDDDGEAGAGDDTSATTASDGTTETTAVAGPQELVGTFTITEGTCSDAGVTEGSWFRMVQADGALDAGPFVQNLDSPCGDKTWNPLLPGSDGGLRSGEFQPFDDPVFDAAGNASTAKIVQPVKFFAVGFAVGTNEQDPQTEEAATPPTITADGGTLTADLHAFAAAWNNQHFNQGSPKPDGSKPGITSDPTGTYDAATGAYTLEWASQIVGGPFNNFTGVWHLEGTFEAAG